MKHQALARVFAVVLAILCLLLLVTGVRGFGKADEELNERRAWEEKYAGRIQTYVELEAELAGSISYDEAQRELEMRLEQHEADASQHRTDTALHTAEKGGNQMGADLIWEAMPELASAKGDLEEARRRPSPRGRSRFRPRSRTALPRALRRRRVSRDWRDLCAHIWRPSRSCLRSRSCPRFRSRRFLPAIPRRSRSGRTTLRCRSPSIPARRRARKSLPRIRPSWRNTRRFINDKQPQAAASAAAGGCCVILLTPTEASR